MEIVLFFTFAALYFVGGYYLTKYIRLALIPFNKYFKLCLLSLSYALLFGIGTLGSGGDPGFALPFPIIWSGLIYVWEWSEWKLFINGVIIPFLFWWILIFVIMIIRHFVNFKLDNDSNKINSQID